MPDEAAARSVLPGLKVLVKTELIFGTGLQYVHMTYMRVMFLLFFFYKKPEIGLDFTC